MTKDQFREMVEGIVERKLVELLGDPDDGLPIRKSAHDRLLRQKRRVARGERGESFEAAVKRLRLE